jgi:hypothetical protein
MNYREFFKNKKASAKDIQSLIPEGVDQKEFNTGIATEKEHTDDEFMAAKIAGDHLKEDPKYYTKLSAAGLEEEEQDECATCGCGDPTDDHEHDEFGDDQPPYDDFNGGLPKLGGALSVPHLGDPIRMAKIISVGPLGKGPADGELSGYSNVGGGSTGKGVAKDEGGIPANQSGDKEPITAGGHKSDNSIATKSVGGAVVPGEGQKQGGPNSQGTIADTAKIDEAKNHLRKQVKEILKEIRFDRESGKWVRIDEGGHKAGCTCAFCKNKGTFGKKKKEDKKDKEEKPEEMDENTVDMKMGPSYKTVQPRLYKTSEDDFARTNQYEPEISEQYDEEEECMAEQRYTELVNAQRNLNETELAEMQSLREKIEKMQLAKRNYGLSQGGVEPNLYEEEKWIQKAVDPKHKGYCTPMSKPTCTPRRKALAKRFKSGDLSEAEVNMKMGPSYKVVQQTLAKTQEPDQFARTNQYDPKVSESGEPSGDMKLTEEEIQALMKERYSDKDSDSGRTGEPETLHTDPNVDTSRKGVELGHPGQVGGFHNWKCHKCGHEITSRGGNRPLPIKWKDGHVCHFIPDEEKDIDEAGIGAVQHSSYRTTDHGNLPQDPDQRWADDLDEVTKKVSKAVKTIQKGQKAKKTKKNPKLKFQPTKHTTSGVHKRKTK